MTAIAQRFRKLFILQHYIRFMFHFMLDLQDEGGSTGNYLPGATAYVQEIIDRNY